MNIKNIEKSRKILKIGVDIDDILASYNKHFIEWYNVKYNTNINFEDIYTFNLDQLVNVSKEEANKLIDTFSNSDDCKNLTPIEYSVEYISHLRDFELISITSRAEHLRDITESWLEKYFPNIFKDVYFVTDKNYNKIKSKGELAKELGVEIFIEDAIHNTITIAKEGIDVVLLDRPWNKEERNNIPDDIKDKIHRVRNWIEIVEKVKEINDNNIKRDGDNI